MAKYTIIYMNAPSVEVTDPVLTLVNSAPSPLPPPTQDWTSYKHNNLTVLEISTEDPDATLVILPPTGSTLANQNVKAKLGVAAGQRTTSTWSDSGNGIRLELNGQAAATTFDLTDNQAPPQALRVTVKRPILASPA